MRSVSMAIVNKLLKHFGIIVGSLLDHFGIILGSFWDHFKINLGSFWEPFRINLESFWDHFWIILGSNLIIMGATDKKIVSWDRHYSARKVGQRNHNACSGQNTKITLKAKSRPLDKPKVIC